jgi:predicted aminopeptidase
VFLVPLALFLFSALAGCGNLRYLSEAMVEHVRIIRSRVPIEDLLRSDGMNNERRDKLKLVLEVRAFASEKLDLPKNKSYTMVSPVKGPYLGWNVFVAPRFSVEPVESCFPIAGCVVYRGFFSKKGALEFVRQMGKRDLDVFLLPFSGYSTLGWCNDPVLTSQLELDPLRLAGLVIHELAHQKLYVPGDSRFNEAFAVTVERAGVLQWLKSTGRDGLVPRALGMWRREDQMATETLTVRAQLQDLYASNLDRKSVAQKKASSFHDLKMNLCSVHRTGTDLPIVCDEGLELNNAYLVPIDTYYSLVPAFQRILDHLRGNLPEFYREAERVAKLPRERRKNEIESSKPGDEPLQALDR